MIVLISLAVAILLFKFYNLVAQYELYIKNEQLSK